MDDDQWWVWACKILAACCAVILFGLLGIYAWNGVDNPNLPITADTATTIFVGLGILLTIVVLVRWWRGRNGGLIEFLCDMIWWS